MIINARTHHGQFLENKDIVAHTVEEFLDVAGREVGYVRPGMDDARMTEVWTELVETGNSYMGWTDFKVVA